VQDADVELKNDADGKFDDTLEADVTLQAF
jgi:hypothetical protein